MSKIITIHAGHNPHGKISCGASDYISESKENRYILKEVKKLLKGKVKFYDTTVSNGKNQKDILQKIVNNCNSKKRDYDFSIHFNACRHSESDGLSKGVEVWQYSPSLEGDLIADRINKNISKLGFKNRGKKCSKQLYFLKNTNKKAFIIECCFVDDEDDAKLYLKKRKEVAKAIADAIIEYCG